MQFFFQSMNFLMIMKLAENLDGTIIVGKFSVINLKAFIFM